MPDNSRQSTGFSVLMPAYNRGQFIGEAIHSVLNQLRGADELVVVDDGSNDNTREILKLFDKHPGVRCIFKEHANAPETRNRAIAEARNEWLLWLDSDDILAPGVLDYYKAVIPRFPDVDVLYGDLEIFGTLRRADERKMVFQDYYHRREMLLHHLFYSNRIPNPGVAVRKKIYQLYGGYDVRFNRLHDYEFWIRTASHINVRHCRKVVCRWRWHSGNMSSGSVETDKKYNAMIVDTMLQHFPVERLFPFYRELNTEKNLAKCYLHIGKQYGKASAYSEAAEKSLLYLLKSITLHSSAEACFELLQLYPSLTESQVRENETTLSLAFLHKVRKTVRRMNGRTSLEKYKIASLFKRLGERETAESRFNELLGLLTNIPGKDSSLLAGVHFHLGEIAMEQNRIRMADGHFEQCLKFNPYHQKASVYREKIQQESIIP